MKGELADILDAAEADRVRNLEEDPEKDACVDETVKMCQGEKGVCVGEVHEL